MNSVAVFLLTIAGSFLIGTIGEIVFRRTQVPDVVWLIAAGIILGPLGGVVTRERLTVIAPYFAAVTLVVVLFEGGSRLNLLEVSRAAPRSTVLALLTFTCAMLAVAVVSMGAKVIHLLPPEWTWKHGFLLGSILGGSSSIIIMPAMNLAKVEASVANLVGLESAFTDAFCVVGASALIDIMLRGAAGGDSPAASLFESFGIAIAIGGMGAAAWLLVLRFLKGSEHAYPITLSALLILYVLIDRARGSAALGILTFAVIVGNAPIISKKVGLVGELDLGTDVRGFHSQVTFIIKSFFFVFIGAMLGPPWSLILFGVLLGLVVVGARAPGVLAATFRSGLDQGQKNMVMVAGPRGMAAGVLATMPAAAGVVATDGLPPLVFSAVLTTILAFAVGFPLARRMRKAPATVEAAPEALPAATAPTVAEVAGIPPSAVPPPVAESLPAGLSPQTTEKIPAAEAPAGVGTAPQTTEVIPAPDRGPGQSGSGNG